MNGVIFVWLVVTGTWMDYFSIGKFIIPTDEVIIFAGLVNHQPVPSGQLLHNYEKWWFVVDLAIKDGDVP